MIDIGIIGANGYLGIELIRILKVHPKVNIKHILKRDTLIEKNDVLKLFVENQIQVDYIKPLLNKLISFIRKSLQNYNITIEIELTENPVEDIKLMHGKDKFKAMAKKNPNLNTLKNLFNLDIEF